MIDCYYESSLEMPLFKQSSLDPFVFRNQSKHNMCANEDSARDQAVIETRE